MFDQRKSLQNALRRFLLAENVVEATAQEYFKRWLLNLVLEMSAGGCDSGAQINFKRMVEALLEFVQGSSISTNVRAAILFGDEEAAAAQPDEVVHWKTKGTC